MFDMLNIFESFLPQLLRYPNAADPLNTEASSLMLRDKQVYEKRIKEYVERYAKQDTKQDGREDDESELSSVGEYSEDELDMEL